MLIQTAADMGVFLLVLIVTLLAFADTTNTVFKGNPPSEHQPGEFNKATSYGTAVLNMYLLVLAQFELDGGPDGGDGVYDYDVTRNALLSWVVFLSATVLDMVVMLNLLVAFVSQTFGEVLANRQENSCKELAIFIAGNTHLLSPEQASKHGDPNEVLIIAESKDLKKKEAGSQESAAAKRRARARDPVQFRARVVQDAGGEQDGAGGLDLVEALEMEVLREVAADMPVRLEELTTALEGLNAGLAKSLTQQEKKEEERKKAAADDPMVEAAKRR